MEQSYLSINLSRASLYTRMDLERSLKINLFQVPHSKEIERLKIYAMIIEDIKGTDHIVLKNCLQREETRSIRFDKLPPIHCMK
jgi:hypothetical protein